MRRLICVVLSLFASVSASANSRDLASPQWTHEDTECPKPSATDRYIDVPVFHDLAAVAEIGRIPGLNLFSDLQSQYRNKKLRIYFELFNAWDPNKELLIFIPGGPGQPHADLHPLVDLFGAKTDLLKRFNLIAMDHRGVGCSRPTFPGNEPTESLMMRQAASDIDLIRRELVGDSGRLHVFGYSYGSILAQTYALLYPKNLGRLFIGGTVSNIDDWHLAAVQFESLVYSAVDPLARQEFEQLTVNDAEVREAFLMWAFSQLYSYKGRVVEIPRKLAGLTTQLKNGARTEVLTALTEPGEVMPWMKRSIACQELFPFTTKFANEFPMWTKALGPCEEYKGRTEYFHYTPLLKQIEARTMIYGGAFDHVTSPKAMLPIYHAIRDSFLLIDSYLGHGFSGKTGCFLQLTAEFFAGASNERLQEISYSPVCQAPPAL